MVAIVTGDIVNSSQLNKTDRKALESFLWDELEKLSGSSQSFSIQRGDAFQFKCEPAVALDKCLTLRCKLKAQNYQIKAPVDARLSIGIGEVSLNGKDISSSDGVAFQISGRGLDALKDQELYLAIASEDEVMNQAWLALAILMDDHIQSWNNRQAEAVLGRLEDQTYEQLGQKLGINPSAVYKRIESAHWKSVLAGLKFYRSWASAWSQAK